MSDVLLLVDGLSVAYRAFHAIRELAARNGRPTNAVYGFVRMWNQLARIWQPTHAAVVFDGGLPDARLAALAEYKAQRPPMPEGLRLQLPDIEEFLRYAGVKALRVEGQEADDVIATLCDQAARDGARVLIATNDKDLFQLIRDEIRIVPPSKDAAAMGPREVLEKTGVPPEKIPEWLALTGDQSDNIPGVPGVGAKTAAQWIRQFGSLDELKRGAGHIGSERLRAALEQNWPTVERNLEMVRLNRNVALPVQWRDLAVQNPRLDDLISFYEKMEFRSLANELRQNNEGRAQLSFEF